MNFYEKYFLINLKDYPALGIDLEINKILLFLVIGAIFAAIFVGYRRAGVASVIRGLLRREAKSEESARTLDDLRANSLSVRLVLRASGGRLSKIISRVGAPKYTYEEYVALTKKRGFKEEKIDFKNAKFFIAEERTDEAKRIYERSESPLFHTVLFCVLLVAIYVCLLFAMPEILDFINSLFT